MDQDHSALHLLRVLYENYLLGLGEDSSLEQTLLRESVTLHPDQKTLFDRCYSSLHYIYLIRKCVRGGIVDAGTLSGLVHDYRLEIEHILGRDAHR